MTAALVERVLGRLGIESFRPAPTSVAAIVGPAGGQPAVGFRADLDALPISETTGATYTSRNDRVMHACGHDGHAAALLGVARRLGDGAVVGRACSAGLSAGRGDASFGCATSPAGHAT
ncbi:MAG: M20/M25/M40 family metallo-hydrolase [Pseudonocardiaceae bacterium]